MRPATRGVNWRRAPILAIAWLGLIGARGALAGPVQAGPTLSPLDRLVAEDEIRQRLALYTLYADGDGVSPPDMPALANQLLTQDAVSEAFPANGGPPLVLNGREPVAHSAPMAMAMPDPKRPVAVRHFLIQTYFDQITPTTARTRSTAIAFRVSRNLVGFSCKQPGTDACGGKVLSSSMWTYHMDWRKTDAGWQISRNVIRDDS